MSFTRSRHRNDASVLYWMTSEYVSMQMVANTRKSLSVNVSATLVVHALFSIYSNVSLRQLPTPVLTPCRFSAMLTKCTVFGTNVAVSCPTSPSPANDAARGTRLLSIFLSHLHATPTLVHLNPRTRPQPVPMQPPGFTYKMTTCDSCCWSQTVSFSFCSFSSQTQTLSFASVGLDLVVERR